MRFLIGVLIATAVAWAGEFDAAREAFAAGRYAEGAAAVRAASQNYRAQGLIPAARRTLQDTLKTCESAVGADSEPVEILCLELAVLYQAQAQVNPALENLARANRIARLRGRFEADRELQLATLQISATQYGEALANLDGLAPRLEKELGATDPRTVQARRMLVTVYRRQGAPEKAAALEAQLGPEQAVPAGQAQPTATGPHYSQSYRRAEANWKQILARGKVKILQNTSQQPRLEGIGAKIAAAGRRNVPWNFFIVQDPSPNAACMGEGFVYVTSGLLQLGLTDDELAGVLAHEIAHGTEMHLEVQDVDQSIADAALRELKDAQALQARYEREYQQDSSQNAESSYQSKMVSVKRRISSAEKKIAYLEGKDRFSQEFGQQQEIEADQVGMRYAVTAGYSAEGLLHALEKLNAQRVGKFGTSLSASGQSHPPVQRRLETLRKVYAGWQKQGFR